MCIYLGTGCPPHTQKKPPTEERVYWSLTFPEVKSMNNMIRSMKAGRQAWCCNSSSWEFTSDTQTWAGERDRDRNSNRDRQTEHLCNGIGFWKPSSPSQWRTSSNKTSCNFSESVPKLETKHSKWVHIWAYRDHSHLNHHTHVIFFFFFFLGWELLMDV